MYILFYAQIVTRGDRQSVDRTLVENLDLRFKSVKNQVKRQEPAREKVKGEKERARREFVRGACGEHIYG